jgi:hypothetical protein
MSAFKEMPNAKSFRAFTYSMWITVLVIFLAFALAKAYAEPTDLPLNTVFGVALVVTIIFWTLCETYHAGHQRCPDCGKVMRSVYEDVHPRAKKHHLLYCERCDIIWDTGVPNAND